MAVRRGVALGGGRRVLPAAARRARRGARPRHPVGHAGARRPARGARRAGALRRVPARRADRDPQARRRRRVLARRGGGARALRGGLRARRRRAGGPAGAARGARELDVGGHARGAAAARDARRRAAPARDRHRRAPRAVRELVRRLLAARVRARAVAGRAARGGGRARRLRRPDRRARPRQRSAAAAAALAGRAAAGAARPGAAGAGLERRRLSVARRVPRHAPADRAPPPGVGGRRRSLRPGPGGRAGARRRGGLRRARQRSACARAGSAWSRSTPSCSACTGTRASPGSPPCWPRPSGRRCGSRRSTPCSPRSSRRPAPELPVTSWGTPRDLSTWSGPAAGGLAWRQRSAELRAVAAAPDVPDRALRELLALQSSDWAFLASRASAGPYPAARAAGHEAAFEAALAAPGDAARSGCETWRRTWRGRRSPRHEVQASGNGYRSFRPGDPYALPLAVENQPSPGRRRRLGAGDPMEPNAPWGESPPECGVAQVNARARQLTP